MRIAEGLERQGRADEAISELEALAAERPGDFEPLFRVGNMLRAQERFLEAVDAYDRAFERLGESAAHWSMYYFRGIALERSGQWERAEPDLLKALDLQPDHPYVMNYLAYSWVEQETNLEQAEAMLVRAVQLRKDDGFIVDSLGWVYYRLGEYDKAVVRLERAVELQPQDPVINDHLGDVYWKVGRRQEARFQWRRALNLEPEADTVPVIETKIESGLDQKPKDI
ncbi:MAG: tetratricopeptide repeat protein [Rhodospirillales bacterium]|nr:tetratricopeptide repeat protein [Rhodospirillales bacterium]